MNDILALDRVKLVEDLKTQIDYLVLTQKHLGPAQNQDWNYYSGMIQAYRQVLYAIQSNKFDVKE